MNAENVLQEFRAIARKKMGCYERKDEALFTLQEIVDIISFYQDFEKEARINKKQKTDVVV